jgi:hypothetical protein
LDFSGLATLLVPTVLSMPNLDGNVERIADLVGDIIERVPADTSPNLVPIKKNLLLFEALIHSHRL